MEKTLRCVDMGIKCDFVAKGKTSREVKKKIMEHAKIVHWDIMKNITPEEKELMTETMNSILKMEA